MSSLPFRLALSLTVLCLAGPALAGDTPDAAAKAGADQTVCRKVVDTGSILPQRICLSRAEWAAIRKKHDEDDQRASDRKLDPAITMGGGGTPWDISKK